MSIPSAEDLRVHLRHTPFMAELAAALDGKTSIALIWSR
jgi:hypothetical protein